MSTKFGTDRFRPIILGGLCYVSAMAGCVPVSHIETASPFDRKELDACLAFVIDQSGSFDQLWSESGHDLFVNVSGRFFDETVGTETRLVIAQLSAADNVVLFEGTPGDLRQRFRTPEELAQFLQESSDSSASNVYRAVQRVTDYLTAMPDVGENTRLMTVVISDLLDSESSSAARSKAGSEMIRSLSRYQEQGGTLALYCVAPKEMSRWRQVLDLSGFSKEEFVIESTLVQSPALPSFQ